MGAEVVLIELIGLLVSFVSESEDVTPKSSGPGAVVKAVGRETAVVRVRMPLAVVVIVLPSTTATRSSFLLLNLPLVELQILFFLGGSGQVESGYRVCRNEL